MKSKLPKGLDLVDERPDYTKTFEEDWEEYRKRYYEVYGEYPPEPGQKGTEQE